MLDALKAGDFEGFKQSHTAAAATELTRAGFEKAVRSLAQVGEPKVKEISGTQTLKKIVLDTGRTLTRLKLVDGEWRNRSVWTR